MRSPGILPGLLPYVGSLVRTNVYIDGFNFYYGALKDEPYRWLDLHKFCQHILPSHLTLQRIKYFTSLIKQLPGSSDHTKADRQRMYWRALNTLPDVDIIEGYFSTSKSGVRPLVKPLPDGTKQLRVYLPEEKGSDVNLASHLLCDAFRKSIEAAVIISDDTDLLTPLQIVKSELGIQLWIFNPHNRKARSGMSMSNLQTVADHVRPIRRGVLEISQLPDVLFDNAGKIERPIEWTPTSVVTN